MNEERRKALLKEKEDVAKQLAEVEQSSTDFGDDIEGGDEETHETEATNLKLGLRDNLKNRLYQIEQELSGDK